MAVGFLDVCLSSVARVLELKSIGGGWKSEKSTESNRIVFSPSKSIFLLVTSFFTKQNIHLEKTRSVQFRLEPCLT